MVSRPGRRSPTRPAPRGPHDTQRPRSPWCPPARRWRFGRCHVRRPAPERRSPMTRRTTIEQLLDAPRAPLTCGSAARSSAHRPGSRRVQWSIEPVAPPDMVAARLAFPEPLLTPEALSGVIGRRAASSARAGCEPKGAAARSDFRARRSHRASDLHRHCARQPAVPAISRGCSSSSSSGSTGGLVSGRYASRVPAADGAADSIRAAAGRSDWRREAPALTVCGAGQPRW